MTGEPRDARMSELRDLPEVLQAKASVLHEALPWIKRFAGRTVVIKYGGAAMAPAQERNGEVPEPAAVLDHHRAAREALDPGQRLVQHGRLGLQHLWEVAQLAHPRISGLAGHVVYSEFSRTYSGVRSAVRTQPHGPGPPRCRRTSISRAASAALASAPVGAPSRTSSTRSGGSRQPGWPRSTGASSWGSPDPSGGAGSGARSMPAAPGPPRTSRRTRAGSKPTPAAPAACRIRPQLGSPPYTAVLTSGLSATRRATAQAAAS